MAESVYGIDEFNTNISQPAFYRDLSGTLNSLEKIIQSSNFDGSIPTLTSSIGVTQIVPGSYLFLSTDEVYPILSVETDLPDAESYYINYINNNEIITLVQTSSAASVVIVYEDWNNKSIGTSGWAITQQGNAIFSNVAVRGDLEATTLDVGGANGIIYDGTTVTIGSSVVINSTLTTDSLQVGASPSILRIANNVSGSSDGIYINEYNYWYADGQFGVGGAAGSAKWDGSSLSLTGNINATSGSFTGALTASVGKIGGFTLNNDALLATNIILSSSGGLRLGSNNQIILTQAGAFTASTASIGGDSTINGTNIGNGGGNNSTNLRVGTNALISNTSGVNNLAIGDYSLENNQGGYSNTGLGQYSLNENINGFYNTAIGAFALKRNKGNYNLAIGPFAAENIVSSTNRDNIAIGLSSMSGSSTSITRGNIAIGSYSLDQDNSTILYNTALGHETLSSLISGTGNVAIGSNSLENVVSADLNIGIGYYALSGSAGDYNIGIGPYSLTGLTNGTNNIAFGLYSGSSITTGDYNVMINYTPVSTTISNNVYIGDGQNNLKFRIDANNKVYVFGELEVNTNSLYVDNTGRVGIGTVSPTNTLTVIGTASISSGARIGAGDFSVDGSLFYVDAGTNRVGVNDSTPSYDLDVNGDVRLTGDLRLDKAWTALQTASYDANYNSGASRNVFYRVHGNMVELRGFVARDTGTVVDNETVFNFGGILQPNDVVRVPVALETSPWVGRLAITTAGIATIRTSAAMTGSAIYLDGVRYFLDNQI